MNESELLAQLRELRFLQDIEDEYLEQIAAIAKPVHFPAGKVIFHEGEALAQVYLIVRGDVSLEFCASGVGCTRVTTVVDGELLGISPLLEQTRMTATARATTAVEAIVLNSGQLLTLCEHNPRFGYEFMRRIVAAVAKRLNATRMQLVNVYGTQLPTVPEQQDK